MTVDFLHGSFTLPSRKREQIQLLAKEIGSSKSVGYKTLERFVGKCTATMVAVPGALIRCRQAYAALALGSRRAGRPGTRVVVSPALAREVEVWGDSDAWSSVTSNWKSASHVSIVVSSLPPFHDGHGSLVAEAFVGVVRAGYFSPVARGSLFVRVSLERGAGQVLADFSWASRCSGPLLEVLVECARLLDARDCFVDLVVSAAWRPSSVFGSDLSVPGGERVANGLIALVVKRGLVVSVVASPDAGSASNMWRSDKGSYVLSRELFTRVEELYGPHAVDAMASDANAQWVLDEHGPLGRVRVVEGGILRPLAPAGRGVSSGGVSWWLPASVRIWSGYLTSRDSLRRRLRGLMCWRSRWDREWWATCTATRCSL